MQYTSLPEYMSIPSPGTATIPSGCPTGSSVRFAARCNNAGKLGGDAVDLFRGEVINVILNNGINNCYLVDGGTFNLLGNGNPFLANSHGGLTQLAKSAMGSTTGSSKINISMSVILWRKPWGFIPSDGFWMATYETCFSDCVCSWSPLGEIRALGALVGLWWVRWGFLRRNRPWGHVFNRIIIGNLPQVNSSVINIEKLVNPCNPFLQVRTTLEWVPSLSTNRSSSGCARYPKMSSSWTDPLGKHIHPSQASVWDQGPAVWESSRMQPHAEKMQHLMNEDSPDWI